MQDVQNIFLHIFSVMISITCFKKDINREGESEKEEIYGKMLSSSNHLRDNSEPPVS